MGDLKPIKAILICGVLFCGGLLLIGLLINSGEEERVAEARAIRSKQQEMVDMALDQARAAQEMQRMHMEVMQAEIAAVEGEYNSQYRDDSGFSTDDDINSYFSQAELNGAPE